MALPVWVDNLVAYSLQIAILASAGTLLAYLFRLRVPRVCFIYWRILLFVCLILPALQNWKHPVRFQTLATSDAIVYEIPKEVAAVKPNSSSSITPEVIGVAIGAGACLRLIWLLFGYLRLRRFLRRSQFLAATSVVDQSISSRIGVQAHFFLSNEIDSPATFGLISPAVILPGSFPGMSEACREAVVCHELLHVRRRDWAAMIVEEIIRSIYWFHPAVWWLLGRIHLAREQSVDHQVVRLTGSRQPYLDSLLEIARSRGRPRAVPATLFLREQHLVQRVALLIKEVSMNRLRLTVSVAGIALLLAGTVRLAAGWFPLTGEPEVVQQQPAIPKDLPHVPDSVGISRQASPAPDVKLAANTHAAPIPENSLKADVPESGEHPADNAQAAPSRREPIKVGGNVQESKLIKRVEPIYPELALRNRVAGRVILTVTVDEEGNVSDIRISQGHPLLSEAAVTAVRQWQYSPTLLNGEPVPVITTVTVIFAIKGDKPEVGSGLNAPSMPLPLPLLGKVLQAAGRDSHIIFRAIPIDGKDSPLNTEDYRVPDLRLTTERFVQWQMMATAEWPPDAAKGLNEPLVYSFIVSEDSALTNFTRLHGPEIPDIEKDVSRLRVISPGLRGPTFVRSWCDIEIRVGLSMEAIQSLIQSNSARQ